MTVDNENLRLFEVKCHKYEILKKRIKYELTAVPSPVVYHLHSVLDNHMDLFAIQRMDKDTLALLPCAKTRHSYSLRGEAETVGEWALMIQFCFQAYSNVLGFV